MGSCGTLIYFRLFLFFAYDLVVAEVCLVSIPLAKVLYLSSVSSTTQHTAIFDLTSHPAEITVDPSVTTRIPFPPRRPPGLGTLRSALSSCT